jgi:hypothetical protein
VQSFAGQGHPKGQRGQDHADQPKPQFAPKIAATNKHAHHVQHDEAEDQEGAIVVEVEDDAPAAGLEQAGANRVGLAGVRHISQREQHAGEDFEYERDREHPAKRVPNGIRFDRDHVLPDQRA